MKDIKIMNGHPSDYPEMVPDKVKIIILDGITGKVIVAPAAEHGMTTIETIKGTAVKLKYNQDFLI